MKVVITDGGGEDGSGCGCGGCDDGGGDGSGYDCGCDYGGCGGCGDCGDGGGGRRDWLKVSRRSLYSVLFTTTNNITITTTTTTITTTITAIITTTVNQCIFVYVTNVNTHHPHLHHLNAKHMWILFILPKRHKSWICTAFKEQTQQKDAKMVKLCDGGKK